MIFLHCNAKNWKMKTMSIKVNGFQEYKIWNKSIKGNQEDAVCCLFSLPTIRTFKITMKKLIRKLKYFKRVFSEPVDNGFFPHYYHFSKKNVDLQKKKILLSYKKKRKETYTKWTLRFMSIHAQALYTYLDRFEDF